MDLTILLIKQLIILNNKMESDITQLKKDIHEIKQNVNKILELINAVYSFETSEGEHTKPEQIKEQPTEDDQYVLFFDGCAKSNPGIAGAGAVIYKNNIEIWGDSKFVGVNETNNVAEYMGLIFGLRKALKLNINTIHVKGDSKLIIEQMKGHYKCKSDNLKDYHEKAKEIANKFTKITYEHVYREFNKRADELSNEGVLKEK
jgi:ribonuclease HI